jgi:3D-(3,5/4)-trihydroxycyclohexane-1,2-dione acylhydrolase (decyclizing)
LADASVFLDRVERARRFALAGSVRAAIESSAVPRRLDLTLAEAVVIGLVQLDVRDFFVVFGHGSTELAEVLRAYAAGGLVRCHPVRHETEASHAATALRWIRGQRAAVVTSIGPGALHAFAGSLVAASNGVGVWHLYGDETTEDEGPNMQQIPRMEQGSFLRLTSVMGGAYSLHTAAAVGVALRRGADVVDHPYRAGPFFLLLPINTQPTSMPMFNLDELPVGEAPRLGAAPPSATAAAAKVLHAGNRVVVKLGGGARGLGIEVERVLVAADAVAVTSPASADVLGYSLDRNMGVGGSKGSISGNYAMEHADTLLVIGSRAVCQADCSRTGYPEVRNVVNVNADLGAAMHYQRSLALLGDAQATLVALADALHQLGPKAADGSWLAACSRAKGDWDLVKAQRRATPTLRDSAWGGDVLTQPAAIDVIASVAARRGATLLFDAGDVQANGFQMLEPREPGSVYTEAGASYMGFAASGVLATAVSRLPFYAVAVCGDGSFTMNPQVLIDGVALGATGCIIVLDNRRMGAISSLQRAQYGRDFATSDGIEVDYVAWARAVRGVFAVHAGRSVSSLEAALREAFAYKGLSLVHVPVYFGDDPLGGLGAYGRWNVGPWVDDVQAQRHRIAL